MASAQEEETQLSRMNWLTDPIKVEVLPKGGFCFPEAVLYICDGVDLILADLTTPVYDTLVKELR